MIPQNKSTTNFIKHFTAILFSLSLAACASAPTGTDAPDIGEKPTDEQVLQVTMDYLNKTLKDPDSIKQFKVTEGPWGTTWYRGLLNGGGYEGGWVVCFEYNAKNSYGAYVGAKKDSIVIRRSGDSAYQVGWVNWGLASTRCM